MGPLKCIGPVLDIREVTETFYHSDDTIQSAGTHTEAFSGCLVIRLGPDSFRGEALVFGKTTCVFRFGFLHADDLDPCERLAAVCLTLPKMPN